MCEEGSFLNYDRFIMIKDTRSPYCKMTLRKLRSALLRLYEENRGFVIPDEHSVWYKTAGITKKTFNNTIRTYDNFLYFTKQYLLDDLEKYMLVLEDNASVGDGLKVIMRFCFVTSLNEGRREEQIERRDDMIMAAWFYNTEAWAEIMKPLVKAIKLDYPFLEEAVLYESYWNWVAICQRYFREWADRGMDQSLAIIYRKFMMHYYRQIFASARDIMFIRKELGDIEKGE